MLELSVDGGKVVLNLDDADGFLGAILPSGSIELDLDFALSWSSATGLHFKGNAGAEVELPVDFGVGPVKVNGLHLALLLGGDSAALEVSSRLAAQLGPIAVAVDRLGARLKLTQPAGGGTIGAADLTLEFKPPTGVGLSIGTAGLSGGGFLSFDPQRGEYAGALELQLADFLQVKAIGLISTRQPDGTPGFSLLIVLTAEFGSGIQLGLGFTLLAVGGLVGLHRAMNLQALVEGVRTERRLLGRRRRHPHRHPTQLRHLPNPRAHELVPCPPRVGRHRAGAGRQNELRSSGAEIIWGCQNTYMPSSQNSLNF